MQGQAIVAIQTNDGQYQDSIELTVHNTYPPADADFASAKVLNFVEGVQQYEYNVNSEAGSFACNSISTDTKYLVKIGGVAPYDRW